MSCQLSVDIMYLDIAVILRSQTFITQVLWKIESTKTVFTIELEYVPKILRDKGYLITTIRNEMQPFPLEVSRQLLGVVVAAEQGHVLKNSLHSLQ